MIAMNAPTAAAVHASRRLLLLPVDGRGDELVRRYRLARLSAAPPPPAGAGPLAAGPGFEHLKRMHD
jgi:hypothetical protein